MPGLELVDISDAWHQLPSRAKSAAENLIDTIEITTPDDSRLHFGHSNGARAALIDRLLVISGREDASEIWHEIAHAIIDNEFGAAEIAEAASYYNFDNGLVPPELLAEDFYFTIKGGVPSPFWRWWFAEGAVNNMAEAKLNKQSIMDDLSPLDLAEEALTVLADLIFDSANEEFIFNYGIIKEALKAAQKEGRLSYEARGGPHQYFYSADENIGRIPPRKEPLRVNKPDVTPRGEGPTTSKPGVM